MDRKTTHSAGWVAANESRIAIRRVAAGTLGLVKDRLSQAEGLLLARGGNQKPWYIAIGANNVGTTTWLRVAAGSGRWTGDTSLSGAPSAPVELVCCESALVADISGTLISQDLDEKVESVVWRGVLRQLRRAAIGRMAGILLFVECCARRTPQGDPRRLWSFADLLDCDKARPIAWIWHLFSGT